MNADLIVDVLGTVDESIIQKVLDDRAHKKHKLRFRRWIAAAACLLLIASITLTAEATNGSISNLLAPIFGGAQTKIVDKMGVPVGASTTVDGYTLTVDAIIGDRYSVIVGYTLSRDDGQPIPENIDFRTRRHAGTGYGTRIEIDKEDPSIAHFHHRMRRNESLLDRIVSVCFSDLITRNENGEDTVIAEGSWEFTITLRYPDLTEKLPVQKFTVTDDGGHTYQVKKIMLSPIGIHLDLLFYNPDYTGGIFKDFKMSLIMTDGTELLLPDGGGGGSWTEGDKTADVSYYAEFDIPIPREDIKAIVICGTIYELSNPD